MTCAHHRPDRSPPLPVRGDPPQPPPTATQPDLPLVRPRLRGVFHQYGFLAALLPGTVLVLRTDRHRGRRRRRVRRLGVRTVRRERALPPHHLDAAGPPLAAPPGPRDDLHADRGHLHPGRAAGPEEPLGGGRACGGVERRPRGDRPQPRLAAGAELGGGRCVRRVGLGSGRGAAAAAPASGVVGTALLVGGGVAYSAGALVYARRRPDPAPAGSATTRSSTCWWWSAVLSISPRSPWPSWRPEPGAATTPPSAAGASVVLLIRAYRRRPHAGCDDGVEVC
jgi:hypothetical protein